MKLCDLFSQRKIILAWGIEKGLYVEALVGTAAGACWWEIYGRLLVMLFARQNRARRIMLNGCRFDGVAYRDFLPTSNWAIRKPQQLRCSC
jgi:hypothetical protein